MAILTLGKTVNTSLLKGISLVHEDSLKDGFNNLTLGADSFVMNPNFAFGPQNINGRGGNDTIFTSAGADTVYGGSGDDTISTDKGADKLYGGSGNDRLFGGGDDDRLEGGSGNDFMDGGTGNDSLFGGTGDDVLKGYYGNDFIDGQGGADTLTGGQGYDDFYVRLNDGVDTITDFTLGQDQLFLDWAIYSQFHQIPGVTGFDIAGALVNMRSDIGISTGGQNDGSAELIYDQTTQTLFFDQDGLGGAAEAVALVHLTGVSHLTAADFTFSLAL